MDKKLVPNVSIIQRFLYKVEMLSGLTEVRGTCRWLD
jgi:hypothetical protein